MCPTCPADHLYGGCAAIDGGQWQLVRHVPAGSTWHNATDQLAGIEEYGNPSGGESSPTAFSVRFDATDFNQFLFASGGCAMWLIANKQSVTGSYYDSAQRQIITSSRSTDSYTVTWQRRNGLSRDIWLSLSDFDDATANDVLYSEGGHGTTAHNGFDVYIRLVPQAVAEGVWHTPPNAPKAQPLTRLPCTLPLLHCVLFLCYQVAHAAGRPTAGIATSVCLQFRRTRCGTAAAETAMTWPRLIASSTAGT